MRGLVSSIPWWVFLVPVMTGMVPACSQKPDNVNPFPGGIETVVAYPPPTETGTLQTVSPVERQPTPTPFFLKEVPTASIDSADEDLEAEASQLSAPTPDPYQSARKQMVDVQIRGRGISDERVLAAMERVPRHEYVPADLLELAYMDQPLPIGFGQTISQPYIVALMTELLELEEGERVLEIGTGSAYQASVLAELTDQVYTIEIVPQLADRASSTLDRLGYDYVVDVQGDGYYGWEDYAPFDAIIVTAAPDHVPPPLLQQLADGGRMVIPIGPSGGYQSLWVMTRRGDEYQNLNFGGVRFVPFTRNADSE